MKMQQISENSPGFKRVGRTNTRAQNLAMLKNNGDRDAGPADTMEVLS